MPPTVHLADDKSALATQIADALSTAIEDALRERGEAHIVLTGGSMGEALMRALIEPGSASGAERDWADVHVWWGDERFVPADDGDRNDRQADEAGLGKLGLNPDNIHRVPASDSGLDLDGAATAYAQTMAQYCQTDTNGLPEQPDTPTFDVLMLGVGPDGHVASLFPQHPAQNCTETTTVAVRESPKPPPERVSLTFPALDNAREVWLMVAGDDKAEAVGRALSSLDPWQCPASAVQGQVDTVWWLDEAAAQQVPERLRG